MQLTIFQQSLRVVIDKPKRDFYVSVTVRTLTHRAQSLVEAQDFLGLNRLTPYLEVQIFQPNLGERLNKNPSLDSRQVAAGEWVPVPQKRDAYGWRSDLCLRPLEYFEPKGLEATINSLVQALLERTCGLTSGKITVKERRTEVKMAFSQETKQAFP